LIAARKSAWFNAMFARHARSRLRATFGRVRVRGAREAREALAGGPLLVVVNHSTWWDPLVILWLSELVLAGDGYALMDAKNLRRLPFFAKVGGFGVDLEDPTDGARGIRYAAKLLGAPGRVVFVFPQGSERSPFAPLELLPGAAQIARVAKRARIVPLALRYVFGASEKPDLWVSLGGAEAPARTALEGVRQQTRALEAELSRIDRAIETHEDAAFEKVSEVAPGRLARFAERALAWLFPL
jgi:1-acyl-sn-glycerol-3-phosphate acyltransferase